MSSQVDHYSNILSGLQTFIFSPSNILYTLLPDKAFLISILHNSFSSKHSSFFSLQNKVKVLFIFLPEESFQSLIFLTWNSYSIIWAHNTYFRLGSLCLSWFFYLNILFLSFLAYNFSPFIVFWVFLRFTFVRYPAAPVHCHLILLHMPRSPRGLWSCCSTCVVFMC